ncbi:hypothetical protein BJ508DRAFT_320052 [Ascobolus immersus RN42]|uniref:Uncharacterized protein n=1 Tax=Ascobolus immersus RN42 TaxID=1160509 RepID=A0A3N4IR82_ASCIM|nr:hypothetical protein BJ508DRAFT_320052 [Ascobolus immersus RN42]
MLFFYHKQIHPLKKSPKKQVRKASTKHVPLTLSYRNGTASPFFTGLNSINVILDHHTRRSASQIKKYFATTVGKLEKDFADVYIYGSLEPCGVFVRDKATGLEVDIQVDGSRKKELVQKVVKGVRMTVDWSVDKAFQVEQYAELGVRFAAYCVTELVIAAVPVVRDAGLTAWWYVRTRPALWNPFILLKLPDHMIHIQGDMIESRALLRMMILANFIVVRGDMAAFLVLDCSRRLAVRESEEVERDAYRTGSLEGMQREDRKEMLHIAGWWAFIWLCRRLDWATQ